MIRRSRFCWLVCLGVFVSSGVMIGCGESGRNDSTSGETTVRPAAVVAAEQPDLKAVPQEEARPSNTATRTKSAFAAIVRAAESGDADAWTKAEVQLHNFGLAAVPVLTERLDDTNPVARELAAMFLAQLGPDAAPAAEGLLRLLDDDSAFARVNAAAALSTFEGHTERVTPVLVALLTDSDVNVRITAATSLRNVGPSGREALMALSESLTDEDSRVRAAAAVTLGELGPKATSSLASLRRLDGDEDEQVRSAALRAIRQIDASARTAPVTIPASATE